MCRRSTKLDGAVAASLFLCGFLGNDWASRRGGSLGSCRSLRDLFGSNRGRRPRGSLLYSPSGGAVFSSPLMSAARVSSLGVVGLDEGRLVGRWFGWFVVMLGFFETASSVLWPVAGFLGVEVGCSGGGLRWLVLYMVMGGTRVGLISVRSILHIGCGGAKNMKLDFINQGSVKFGHTEGIIMVDRCAWSVCVFLWWILLCARSLWITNLEFGNKVHSLMWSFWWKWRQKIFGVLAWIHMQGSRGKSLLHLRRRRDSIPSFCWWSRDKEGGETRDLPSHGIPPQFRCLLLRVSCGMSIGVV